jgi:hypothetical protein
MKGRNEWNEMECNGRNGMKWNVMEGMKGMKGMEWKEWNHA